MDLLLRHRLRLLSRDKSSLQGPFPNLISIQSTTIIDDLDDDVATLLRRSHRNASLGLLSLRHSSIRQLDAVIDGVSHDMGQGVLYRLNQCLIELRLLAIHLKANLLFTCQGEISHYSRKFAPHRVNRLHAGLHDPFLKLRCYQIESLSYRSEVNIMDPLSCLKDLIAGEDKLSC